MKNEDIKTVCIIVPVYNVEKYLDDCIKSILEQTYRRINVVLIDDGSKDRSSEICDKYAHHYNNFTVIHQKNRGLGLARNEGLQHAVGDFVTFIDSDDFISKDHISGLVDKIEGNYVDACIGGYIEEGRKSWRTVKNPLAPSICLDKRIMENVIPRICGKYDYKKDDEIPMSVCMGIYSLDVIKKNNISFHSEREYISEDLLFNIDYFTKSRGIAFSESCGYHYRYNQNSLTKSYLADRLEKQKKLTIYLTNKLNDLNIWDICEQRVYSTFLAWVRNIVKSEQKNASNIGFSKSIYNIKKVCNDPYVRDIVSKYDAKMLTLKPRILNFLIKHNWPILIWIFSAIKNKS